MWKQERNKNKMYLGVLCDVILNEFLYYLLMPQSLLNIIY